MKADGHFARDVAKYLGVSRATFIGTWPTTPRSPRRGQATPLRPRRGHRPNLLTPGGGHRHITEPRWGH